MVGAWVHVSVRDAQILPDIGSDPVGWILVIHRDYVGFVLAWAWHIEIFRSRVKLHAKGKLRLLLADCIDIVWISWVGEVEVTLNVVLWPWYSHELHLLGLFLLNLSDLLGEISILFTNATCRAFTSLGSCAERS